MTPYKTLVGPITEVLKRGKSPTATPPSSPSDVRSPGGGRRELLVVGCVRKKREDNVHTEIEK
jgi:hypothetical protein